jgi:predicted N-acyltransferase
LSEVPQQAWDAMVDPGSVPFLEWDFLEALESSGVACPETGWHPRHLTLWRGNRLVAAAPAYLKDDSHGEFVRDWAWAVTAERLGVRYFPKLLLAVPATPVTGQRILVARGEDRRAREAELLTAAIDYARSEGLSSVHMNYATEDEVQTAHTLGFEPRLGVQYQWLNDGYRTYDDFLARFTAKRRNQLKRERRAVRESGIEIRTLRGEALAGVDPELLSRLYGRRFLRQELFSRLLGRFRHRLELVEARKDGRLVAGAFNLASPTVLFGRNWGLFERWPFLHFAVCLYHSIDECIARGLTRFEPGAGGEHKLVRGFTPSLTYGAHVIFNPQLAKAVADFLGIERAAVLQGLPAWRQETGFKRP